MKSFLRILCAAALLASLAGAASAQQYITGGIGAFDFDKKKESQSTEFLAEWHGNPFYYGFLPVIGAFVNTEGGAYGYAGLNYDWQFVQNWYLTPGFAVGAWRDGQSAHLGGPIEFRSQLELDYKFAGDYRAGIAINHISNAHIYDHNPGEETLLATFSIPFGF